MPRNLGFSDGSSMSVDRTREAGERTLGFSDGSSLKVNRATGKKEDRAGESRPLLGKLVGRSSIAYSLRDLHDKQGNNKVVRVRRGADNFEKDFRANELYSIVDWTNGKLETTLPADIASAEAAYSLRKVKANYSDNAVRIRRISDDIEVDVAFDSDGKVSASSPITNIAEQGGESGQTTATTLKDFLNEEHEITSSAVLANKPSASVQGTVNEATNNLIDFTVNTLQKNNGNATTNMWLLKIENHNKPSIGKIRISCDCTHFDFENGGNLFIQPFHDHNGNGSLNYANALTITGTGHYTREIDLTTRQVTSAFRIFRSGVAVGDRVRIENLKIESLRTGATVHTWYDQAGSNNAVQNNAAYQPKIAENGALILDDNNLPVIDDLGNGQFLEFENFIYDSSDTSYSFFMKLDKKSQTTGAYWLLGDSLHGGDDRGGGADRGWKVQQDRIVHYFHPYEGDQNFNHGYRDWGTNNVLTFIAKSDNVTYQLFNNAVQLGSDSTKSSSRYSPIKRIMQASDSNTINDFQGTLSELIFYNTDQSANRFKIESNINNYYNLYTSNTNSAFVDIWYDQGGGNYHFTQEDDTLQPTIVDNGVYLGGLYAPVNNAISGSKVHMLSTFRNQNFPANTTGISYFLVGHDLSADNGNNKGTLFGSFRGVANYVEGQQGIALDGITQFGFYNGLTTDVNHFQYKTVNVPNSTFPNKTVLLVASIQDKKGTVYVNEETTSGDMSRLGGTALENLNLESDPSVDADRHYIRLFAPNRDNAYRAHNYSYGIIKEAILYPSSNSDNLEAIRDNINNQYQIY